MMTREIHLYRGYHPQLKEARTKDRRNLLVKFENAVKKEDQDSSQKSKYYRGQTGRLSISNGSYVQKLLFSFSLRRFNLLCEHRL